MMPMTVICGRDQDRVHDHDHDHDHDHIPDPAIGLGLCRARRAALGRRGVGVHCSRAGARNTRSRAQPRNVLAIFEKGIESPPSLASPASPSGPGAFLFPTPLRPPVASMRRRKRCAPWHSGCGLRRTGVKSSSGFKRVPAPAPRAGPALRNDPGKAPRKIHARMIGTPPPCRPPPCRPWS